MQTLPNQFGKHIATNDIQISIKCYNHFLMCSIKSIDHSHSSYIIKNKQNNQQDTK